MIHDGIAPRGRQALLATLGLLLVPFLAHEAPAAPRMSTTPSWIVPGDQSNALFGENAITAGDVDGDGFSDILVGARTYANGEASEGRMMIFRGGPSGVSSTPFRTYESDEVGAQYGASVACLGDATGDGFDDVAVGAPAYGASDIGAVFVYKGSASGPPAGGANRTLLGDGIDNGGFGGWVSDAGDVNGDGFQDLLVGSSLYSNGQANEGRALLYLGAAGGVSTSASWIVESNVVGARFGYRVSTAGDVNGDGFDDVLIGAVRFTNGQTTEGKAFLYLGSAAGLSTTPAWQVEGEQTGANLGASLANAGDVNADGYADFLIGAQAYDNGNTNEGRVYLFLGSPTPISTTPARTYEGNEDAALLGTALGTAGDVNGDGYADYLIGGSGFDAGGTNRGKAMLFLGGGGTPPASPAFTYLGPQDGDSFADCAVTAGDIDADGYSDFLIGASHYDGAINEGGAVFGFQGAAAVTATNAAWGPFGQHAGDLFGYRVLNVGDLNADGFDDVLVSAPRFPVAGRRDGAVSCYLGSEAGLANTPFITLLSPNTDESGTGFGWGLELARAGDLNGDGFDDFLIADYNDATGGISGRVQMMRGASGAPLPAGQIFGENDELLGVGMTAGDWNGDGYSDFALSGPNFDAPGLNAAGRVRVYNGSGSWPDQLPDWEVRGTRVTQLFGRSIANAGDVNGDGFDDLLIHSWLSPTGNNRGQVELYLGSTNGLGATPAWSLAGAFDNQVFGMVLASCGDIDGDGFADVAITSAKPNSGSTVGQVQIFLGGPSGLAATPLQTFIGAPTDLYFGGALASAGDVNNDGRSDLLIGTSNYSTGHAGHAELLMGGTSGSSLTLVWTSSTNNYEDQLGTSVTGGGDVNGDGYSDITIGAPTGRPDEFTETGFASTYLGNDGAALTRNLLQLHLAGSSTRISTGGRQTHSFETIAIQLNARSACGRSDVRPELDRRLLGTAFAGVTHTGPYLDTGAPVAGQGSELLDTRTYSGFFLGSSFHWRIRNHSVNPFFPHTPWFYPQGNSPMATDVRMLPVTADAPEPLVASARLELAPPMPNPTAATTTIRFELATPGSVRLALYDASGREVRELLDTPLAAGRHSAQWDGRDAGGRAVASGVYFARLVKGASVATQKVVVRR